MISYKKDQKRVLARYKKIGWSELTNLDLSLIRWLEPRLKAYVKKTTGIIDWEGSRESDNIKKIKRLLYLCRYIIDEAWYEDPELDKGKPWDLESCRRDEFAALLADVLWCLWY